MNTIQLLIRINNIKFQRLSRRIATFIPFRCDG
jgi:hypothetical protein